MSEKKAPLGVLGEIIADPTALTLGKIDDIIKENFFEFLAGFAGAIAVIYVILGGYQYLTSGGDPQKQASAKATIFWALVGLAIIILAQAIVAIWENILQVKPPKK